jgi:serine protease Do
MESLKDLERAFEAVAQGAAPSVVRIGRGGGRGSGVVVAGGRILTNTHNLRSTTTTVTYADGHAVQGQVLGADVDGDLALLDTGEEGAAPITWEPAGSAPRLGQLVLTLTPTGDGVRVTAGYVSATGRTFRGPRGHRISGGFEHTAPLGPGASGGPVLDVEGRLLGIDTHRLDGGFYLAVPADEELARRVEQLSRGEAPRRIRLGVGLAPATVARRMRQAVGLPEREGLLVRAVEDGSPARHAGIREGDLLVRAGERDLASVDDLQEALSGIGDATSIVVAVVRGVEELLLTVEFEAPGGAEATGAPEAPEAPEAPDA